MPNQTTPSKTAAPKQAPLRGRRTSTDQAPQKLKLLVTIVGRNKAELYMDLLQSQDVNFQMAMNAHGTASTETLRLLGLTDSDKTVIFSVLREDRAKETMALLDEKFRTVRGGKGIAYTIPLTSVIGATIYRFLSNNRMPVKEGQ